eukprot:258173-Rhodomonas_salina.3
MARAMQSFATCYCTLLGALSYTGGMPSPVKLKAYTSYFSLAESYALKDTSSIKQLQEKQKTNEMLALK